MFRETFHCESKSRIPQFNNNRVVRATEPAASLLCYFWLDKLMVIILSDDIMLLLQVLEEFLCSLNYTEISYST